MSDDMREAGFSRVEMDPSDLINFLPWACQQLNIEVNVILDRVIYTQFTSPATTARRKSKHKVLGSRVDETTDSSGRKDNRPGGGHVKSSSHDLRICAANDHTGNIVSLKFEKCPKIPCQILKLIGLIIPYHQTLTQLTLSKGVDKMCIYEISKFLPQSKIEMICLDQCVIAATNCYLLLDRESNLQHLSLSRCRIDDDILSTITERLAHPSPGAKSLCILNLSTNFITDEGAKHLAKALRSNRRLSYLNLADNMIDDKGFIAICNIMKEFELGSDELYEAKKRYIQYIQSMNTMVLRKVQELREIENNKLKRKRTQSTINATLRKKFTAVSRRPSRSVDDTTSMTFMDDLLLPTATAMAQISMGPFSDPFGETEKIHRGGKTYCKGNSTLTYLNVSYNNLTIFSSLHLLSVFRYQRSEGKDFKGLLTAVIEGNYLPVKCTEQTDLDSCMDIGLTLLLRRNSNSTKRRITKTTPRLM